MWAGADDFLPVLIYVVIHANPPQLASNLEYIQRFRMHSRMVSESAYFFTQLVCYLSLQPQAQLHQASSNVLLRVANSSMPVLLLSCSSAPAML